MYYNINNDLKNSTILCIVLMYIYGINIPYKLFLIEEKIHYQVHN